MSSAPLTKDKIVRKVETHTERHPSPARVELPPMVDVRIHAAATAPQIEARPSLRERFLPKIPKTRDETVVAFQRNWYGITGTATALAIFFLGGGLIGGLMAGGFMYAAHYLKLNRYLKGAAIASVLLFQFLTAWPLLLLTLGMAGYWLSTKDGPKRAHA
ncbi:MAG: hypothetical protein AAB573_02065 [Patescibacteria group bacterium]